MRPYWFLPLLVAGCGGTPAPTDPSDGGADAGTFVMPPRSGLTTAECASPTDLNAMGALAGETLTYQGDTTNAPAIELPVPCQPHAAHVGVLRYRVRGDNVRLRISTNNPGGTAVFDTVLWALPACTQDAVALGCNDDDGAGNGPQEGTSTLLLGSQRAGTVLYIGIAGYGRAHRGAVGFGRYVLTVTEAPSAAPGATCDPTVAGGCTAGYDCAAGSATAGVCTAPIAEHKPDNDAAHAQMVDVSAPVSVAASLTGTRDASCFAFTVPAHTSLFLEAGDGAGHCPGDLRADLYRAGEADPFDGDDDTGYDMLCPRVFPTDNAGVHDMPAGAYVFCVRVSPSVGDLAVPHYYVHLGPAR